MKYRYAGVLAGYVLNACLVLAPAHAEDLIKIAVVTHSQSSDSYWGVVKRGVDDAAKLSEVGVSVTVGAIPLPLTLKSCGPVGALSAIDTVAE